MKNLILIIALILPLGLFAQQQNGWTPEQQAEFQKQMAAFQEQMQSQMKNLQDSLALLNERLNNQNRIIDSSVQTYRLEAPEIPSANWEMHVMPGGDTTVVRIGSWKMSVGDEDSAESNVHIYKDENCDTEDYDEPKNVETKFFMLDVGLNNYFGKNFDSNLPAGYEDLEVVPGKSWVVNLHVINQKVNLISHVVNLDYGLYFEFNSYRFRTDDLLIPNIDSVAFSAGDVNYSKNKLSPTYIGVPLMLRFETNPYHENHSFHISVGGFGEYLLGAHTKTKSDETGKTKYHDDFNLNSIRYGLTGRIGYDWVNLFVNYGMSELFASGTGPILYPFSAGLAFEF